MPKQCHYQQEAYAPSLNLGMDFQDLCLKHWVLASFDNCTYFLFSFSVLFIIISELGFHFSSCFQKPLSYFLFNLLSLMCSIFQVAIHSVLEKLFRSIWSLPNSRAPFAIKYFFDFLDAQAENKKITDPDVVHIWKTNRWEQQ